MFNILCCCVALKGNTNPPLVLTFTLNQMKKKGDERRQVRDERLLNYERAAQNEQTFRENLANNMTASTRILQQTAENGERILNLLEQYIQLQSQFLINNTNNFNMNNFNANNNVNNNNNINVHNTNSNNYNNKRSINTCNNHTQANCTCCTTTSTSTTPSSNTNNTNNDMDSDDDHSNKRQRQ